MRERILEAFKENKIGAKGVIINEIVFYTLGNIFMFYKDKIVIANKTTFGLKIVASISYESIISLGFVK